MVGNFAGYRSSRVLSAVLPALFFLVIASVAGASVKPPVHVDFVTGWKAEKGGAMIQVAQKDQIIPFRVEISSGIDLDMAAFELILPSGVEMASGSETWAGTLQKGGVQTLEFSVRISSDHFGVIEGDLFLPDYGVNIRGMLDLRDPDKTGRVPEFGLNTAAPSGGLVPFESKAGQPADGMVPTDPMPEQTINLPDRESDIKKLGASDPDPVSSCSVRATGRLVYIDDHGATIGIHWARVILWDEDDDWDDECGRGITDWNGYYDISGSCGDPFGGNPDIYIQNYSVHTSYAQVGSPYTSKNPTINSH
ncbi:MAG: hypothetical protein D3926_18530 [Desulfobacteraceae bacterium]|nr:MAG: hypothetical protein D3926_18530 [Desulfobacteraceae bacterium]